MTIPVTERLATLESKIVSIEDKVDTLGVKMDKLIDGLDKRYASKLSERIVYGLVTLIMFGFMSAVISNYIGLHPATNPGSTTTGTTTTTLHLGH